MAVVGRLVLGKPGTVRLVEEVVEEGAGDSELQPAADQAGRLGRCLPGAPTWYVPRVELRGGVLQWRLGKAPGLAPPTAGAAGALDGFIRLVAASDEEVLAYARRWGMLQLCKHDRPFTHDRRCVPVGQ